MVEQPTHADLHASIARLDERVSGLNDRRQDRDAVLDARFLELKDETKALREDVAEIRDMIAEGRGGWKVIATASGVIGALGGMVGPTIIKKLFGAGM